MSGCPHCEGPGGFLCDGCIYAQEKTLAARQRAEGAAEERARILAYLRGPHGGPPGRYFAEFIERGDHLRGEP